MSDGVRIVCYWSTLFGLAKRAAETRDEGDVAKHEEYEQLCLRADEMR